MYELSVCLIERISYCGSCMSSEIRGPSGNRKRNLCIVRNQRKNYRITVGIMSRSGTNRVNVPEMGRSGRDTPT